MRVGPIVSTASAVLVFLGASTVVRGLVPWPANLLMRPKFEAFEEHKDEFDALFMGSSRMHDAIVPEVLDPLLSTPERSFRSFNLGLKGGSAYEVDHLIERVVELQPARLKYLIVEVRSFDPWVAEEHRFNERAVQVHCTEHTLRALQRTWQIFLERHRWDEPLDRVSRECLELCWDHVQAFSWRLGNYGTGPRTFMALSGLDGAQADPHRARYSRQRGFDRLEELAPLEPAGREQQRRRFEQDQDDFARAVEDLRSSLFREAVPLPEQHVAMFARQLRRIEQAGLRVVLIVPPGTKRDREVETMHEHGLLPDVLWFQDPAKYPELFTADLYLDGDHLNTRGAERFSRVFAAAAAERFVD